MSVNDEAFDLASGRSPEVLVAGAGPTGLLLACELRRWGVPCRIIDAGAGPTPPSESRALGIQARTLEVLERAGVTASLVARGRRVGAINAWDAGRRFARFELDFTGLGTPYPFLLILSQGETEQALVDALARAGTRVEWNTRLTDLRQDPSGVTAVLQAASGEEFDLRARYLVGCDGAHSTVRHRLDLPFEGHPYEEQFLLADAPVEWGLAPDEAHVFLTPAGPLPAIPLPEPGCWRLIGPTGVFDTTDPEAIPERLTGLLHGAGHPGVRIGTPVWASAFRIHRRVTRRLRVGRCLLAGDAAHIHSPVGGQGMNVGLQDAANLAWKLALVVRGAAPESLLDSYDAERLPVARAVLRGTHRATRMVLLRHPVARALRNRLSAWLSGIGFVRRSVTRGISGLGVRYRGSPAVAGDRTGSWAGPRPGDRLPDVALTTGLAGGNGNTPAAPRRLFDLLREPQLTLLYLPGAAAATAPPDTELDALAAVVELHPPGTIALYRVVREAAAPGPPRAAAGVLVDATGDLHRALHADAPCLYLVRPDGHVGYRSRPPDASRLQRYLQRLLL